MVIQANEASLGRAGVEEKERSQGMGAESGDGGAAGGTFWGKNMKNSDGALLRLVPRPSSHMPAILDQRDQGHQYSVCHSPTHPGSPEPRELCSGNRISPRAASPAALSMKVTAGPRGDTRCGPVRDLTPL